MDDGVLIGELFGVWRSELCLDSGGIVDGSDE